MSVESGEGAWGAGAGAWSPGSEGGGAGGSQPRGPLYSAPVAPPRPPGNDVVIVAQVNGKELPGKPSITWFKGKWLELGIKSGARFSFKETHDPASNVSPHGLPGGGGRGRRSCRRPHFSGGP